MAVGDAGVAVVDIGKGRSTAKPFKMFLSRYFYLGMGLMMAGIIVWGFSHTVDAGLFHASPPRPLLLWIHGAAFSTWVVFFIAQSALVRVRKVSVHRLLGWLGAGLATAMVGLGVTVAVVMTRFDLAVLHQKDIESFLSIPFADMILFGAFVGLALYWRRQTEYHRRLVFMASCALMDAGFGRIDFLFNHSVFYLCSDVLIVLGMVRDWTVDRKVHRAYWYGLGAMVVLQNFAIYLWRVNPGWWQGVTRGILA